MAKKSITERIAQLDARKKTLQARLAKTERARDTRRKVLLGAFLLHRLQNDRQFGATLNEWVRRELPGFLTRESDKALFADLLGASNAGGAGAAADALATLSAVGEQQQPSAANVDIGGMKISALAEKPVRQIGKTAEEVLGHRFDENV